MLWIHLLSARPSSNANCHLSSFLPPYVKSGLSDYTQAYCERCKQPNFLITDVKHLHENFLAFDHVDIYVPYKNKSVSICQIMNISTIRATWNYSWHNKTIMFCLFISFQVKSKQVAPDSNSGHFSELSPKSAVNIKNIPGLSPYVIRNKMVGFKLGWAALASQSLHSSPQSRVCNFSI